MGYRIEVIGALVGWPGRTWAFWRCSLSLEETGVFWDGVMCFQIGAWRLISTGFCHQSMDVFLRNVGFRLGQQWPTEE